MQAFAPCVAVCFPVRVVMACTHTHTYHHPGRAVAGQQSVAGEQLGILFLLVFCLCCLQVSRDATLDLLYSRVSWKAQAESHIHTHACAFFIVG